MTPTNTGAKDGDENSLRSSVVYNLSLRGGGRPLRPAASSAPSHGGDDDGRLADSPHGGEDIAPTKTGAKDGEENSLRSSA